jgi:phospholipid N-methyltransferase
MASIEREVENALLNAISAVTGVNFYTSERGSARTLPNVVAKASIGSEELGPFTGVFTTPASLIYTARADTISRTEFDAKFQSIMGQLYRSPDLASYMTSNSNITCFLSNVTAESPSVIKTNRTWSKEITLDIKATAKK